MTAAQHRAGPGRAAAGESGLPAGGPRGAGPGGMWWVAWRQHRIAVLVAVVVMVAIAVALLVFRLVLVARMHAIGCVDLLDPQATCTANGATNVFDENTWRLLRAVMIGAPIVLGVFLGAPIFPREFEQRTEVFALTQSVGRMRWWATKVTVVGTPLLVGLLGLGFLQQWCDAATWFTSGGALRDGTFQVRSIVPAAFGLLAIAISVTAGIVIRSVTGALAAGLIMAAGLVLVIGFPLRSHLLPTTRQVTPIAQTQQGMTAGAVAAYNKAMEGVWFLGSGTLNASGDVVRFDMNACPLPPPPASATTGTGGSVVVAGDDSAYTDAMNKALDKCQQEQGIVSQYTDYLPASMLWPLRGVVTGICLLLAAAFLWLGAWRLRAAPRSRR